MGLFNFIWVIKNRLFSSFDAINSRLYRPSLFIPRNRHNQDLHGLLHVCSQGWLWSHMQLRRHLRSRNCDKWSNIFNSNKCNSMDDHGPRRLNSCRWMGAALVLGMSSHTCDTLSLFFFFQTATSWLLYFTYSDNSYKFDSYSISILRTWSELRFVRLLYVFKYWWMCSEL